MEAEYSRLGKEIPLIRKSQYQRSKKYVATFMNINYRVTQPTLCHLIFIVTLSSRQRIFFIISILERKCKKLSKVKGLTQVNKAIKLDVIQIF